MNRGESGLMTMLAESDAPSGNFRHQMGLMMEEIGLLSDNVSRLRESVDPALLPYNPQPQAPESSMKEDASISHTAQFLKDQTDRLRILNSTVRDMIERVAL